MTMEAQDGAIQPYQDTGLVRVDSKSLALTDTPQRRRFFLPTDVLISKYGVLGFVLLDSHPEQRWVTYTDAEWIGTHTDEDSIPYDARDDRVRRSHFLNTDTGFKMIRYFVLPQEVGEFFKRDRFLGEPMIDKCCRDGTLPEEFDEIPAAESWAFPYGEEPQIGVKPFIDEIIESVTGPMTREERIWRTNHRIYLSFHAWENLNEVVSEGERSVVVALVNFDTVLGRADSKGILSRRLALGDSSSNLPATT